MGEVGVATVQRSRVRSRGLGQRVLAGVVVVVLLVGAAGAGWWAARATMLPTVPLDEGANGAREVVWATASQSSVGRSLPLAVTLQQPANVVAVNGLSGIVTAISPGPVNVGDTVFEVAGVPVRVVTGEVPFYRDLSESMTGVDVDQLQQAMIELQYLEEASGSFDEATTAAVQAWQEDLGIETTGVVLLGEVVAVPVLPTVVQLGTGLEVARQLGGGEDAVLAPTGEQNFVLAVTPDQSQLIPAEATVEVTWQEQTWEAVITGSTQSEFGGVEFDLAAPDGGPVCADACDTLPGDAQVTLRSQVVIVPRITGTAVPAAAVRTRADGSAHVLTEEGEQPVQVAGSGAGIAIVEGITEGTRVQVLGPDPTPGTVPSPETPPGPPPGDDNDNGNGDGDDGDAPSTGAP